MVSRLGARDRKIEARLRQGLEPDKILGWWYELGSDAYGDPGVWVWLLIPDEAVAKEPLDQLLDMSEKIGDAIRRDGRYWPYFNLMSKSEHEALAP